MPPVFDEPPLAPPALVDTLPPDFAELLVDTLPPDFAELLVDTLPPDFVELLVAELEPPLELLDATEPAALLEPELVEPPVFSPLFV